MLLSFFSGVKDQENAKGFSLEPFIMDLIPLYKPTRTVTLRRGVSKGEGGCLKLKW